MARGHTVAMEVKVPVRYMGELLQYQRLDLLVDGQVIVEIKATPLLAPGAHNSCTTTCDSRRMTSDYCCTSVRIPPSRA